MTKKTISIIFLALSITIFSSSCYKNNNKPDSGELLVINNSEKPTYGSIELQLEPVLEIASKSVPMPEGYVCFRGVMKDSIGNYYIVDWHSIKIYKFNTLGEYVKSFLRKGEGPGELANIEGYTIIDNVIYCSNRFKYCCFDTEGNLIKHITLKNQAPGIIEHVDPNRYITYKIIYDEDKVVGNKCILVDIRNGETELYTKMSPNIGFSVLKLPDKDFLFISETSPRIKYRYNPINELVYCYYNYDYSISLIDLNGNVYKIIKKDHSPIKITDDEIDDFVQSYKSQGWPPLFLHTFKKNPPFRTWPAITNIQMLANSYFAVKRPLSVGQDVLDIFDDQGQFRYLTKGGWFTFYFTNGIGKITSKEDGDYFIEYKVNPPLPFFSNGR